MELQIYKNAELGSVRTAVIGDEPFFVGKDVAEILGYSNPQKALRDHVDEEDKTLNDSFTVNGTKGVLIFSASDLVHVGSDTDYEDLRHSAQRLSSKWNTASARRHEQARAVRQEIDNSPHPVVVVGDLNDVALSYTYYTISKGLHDAWLETSWGKWGSTFDLKGSFGVRIDYIFCQDPIIPIQCAVKKTTGSDHSPVVAELAW